MNPDNARIPRITAAAGTELADAYSLRTLIGPPVDLIAPQEKKLRGMAGSGFRPLTNIPHCCLP